MNNIKLFVVSTFVLILSSAVQANIIYDIDVAIGAGSWKGTIETDGTLGLLDDNHILSWSALLNDGSDEVGFFNSTQDGASLYLDTGAWRATATSFYVTRESSFQIRCEATCSGNDLWTMGFDSYQSPTYLDHSTADSGHRNRVFDREELLAGTRSASVPEPTSIGLLALGLAGLGLRRKAYSN